MGGRGRAGAASLEKVAGDARALLGAKRAGAGTGPRHLSALKFGGARRRAARVCGAPGQRGGRAAALLRLSAGRRAERGFHSRWRGAVARRAQLRVVPMVLGFFRVFVSLEFVNCLQQNGAVG